MSYLGTSPESVLAVATLFLYASFYRSRTAFVFGCTIFCFLILFFKGYSLCEIDTSRSVIVSPSDGTVKYIGMNSDGAVHIKLMLSLLDRHVQVAPVDGTVESVFQKPGQFHPVYFFEKTDYNERRTTVLKSSLGPVAVTQVAGQIARRIVPFTEVGCVVKKGQPIGFIKFGSRVDITFPPSVHPSVSVGDKVKIGQMIGYVV